MKLLTKEIRRKLPPLYSTEDIPLEEKIVVVKFFSPTSNWTWFCIEASAILSDGREVSLREADEIMYNLRSQGHSREVQAYNTSNDNLRSLPKQEDRSKSQEQQRQDVREPQPELERRVENLMGLRVPKDANSSQIDKERLCETGRYNSGRYIGTSSSTRGDCPSRGQEQGKRRSKQFGTDVPGRASTLSHSCPEEDSRSQPESCKLEVVDILFFGLVDGFEKEWGYFSLKELESVRGPLGLGIERDLHFKSRFLTEVERNRRVES